MNHLLVHREQPGLTRAALAEAIGVSRKAINMVERGHYVPSTVLALCLAEALGTTVETLFELPE